MPAINLAPANNRGFLKGKFKDHYGVDCSIQKSSLATEDCIWLGCDGGDGVQSRYAGVRMHLTQSMVANLIPLLQRFVETGELAE
jgi:hypothetical protein